MLNVNKADVDFLVTAGMVDEARALLTDHLPRLDAQLAPVLADIARVNIVACGSPLCAGQTAQLLFDAYSTVPCVAYSAADFVSRPPHGLDGNSLTIAISDSGTTQEVVAALELARRQGSRTLAITKTADTPLAQAAEFVLPYQGGSIWTLHLIAMYHIAADIIAAHQGSPEMATIKAQLPALPEVMGSLIERVEDESRELGVRAAAWPMIYTVAGGNLVPLAYKEGVITMMEFTWTHGCALNAAEFRHGPLEVVEKGVPYVVLLGTGPGREDTERALGFLRRHTDDVIVFDAAELGTGLHPALDPMTLFVPLEFFYYYLSLEKGHHPDHKRYYGGKVEY